VIDEEGRLVEPDGLTDVSPGVEREFVAPLLEIKTAPCSSGRELRREFYTKLRAVLERGEELDRKLVPLATPSNCGTIRDLPDERTRVQAELIGEEFEYVRHCAGTHIHVEQQPECTVEQVNAFIALDPALALVNSSPYYQGEAIATGARSKLYRWLAYEGLPHQGRLWSYIDDRPEWDRRLERRYEEFVTAALDAGIDRQVVEAHFDPENAVWTPVQIRDEFDTVEWRSPDTAVPSQVLRIADQLVEIVEHLRTADVRIEGETPQCGPEEVVLPEFAQVLTSVNTAVEDGLTEEVQSYLDGLGFETDAYHPHAASVSGRGSLTGSEARQLRLDCAERLTEDVNRRVSAADD
jgi:gamma-glutamyl:cysteine ligase YbdK (ATP-grasp superfamily)